jgi:hypothetical protein
MPKTQTRMERGICLFRERGHEIVEVEAGVYRVPASEGGGFYRVDLNRQTCECKDRAPVYKHLYSVTIFAAKKRCRRAIDHPQRRHGQPSGSPGAPAAHPVDNTPAPGHTTTPRRSEGDSLRGILVNPDRLAETAKKLGV